MTKDLLTPYFDTLIKKVEASDIQNNGKDANGFFEPTRELLLQRLHLLKDLHEKPNAKSMVRSAWKYVVDHMPVEWLILSAEEKAQLKKVLG